MRINFKTSSVPTRAAKRLKSILSIKESLAWEWTAQVFGYRNWHELTQCLSTEPPSPFDEECPAEERRARSKFQSDRLRRCLANHKEVQRDIDPVDVVSTWRPSSQYPHLEIEGWFAAPAKRFARSLILGEDELLRLEELSPALLADLPAPAQAWLTRDACTVARKLLRGDDPAHKTFARRVLEDLHARGSFAATLHLAASLMRPADGPGDHTRAGQLFAGLLESAQTPPNVRALAAEGCARVAGNGAGWPDDLAKAEATWERRAREGDGSAAYCLALRYDPFKPLTREAPADPAKAVTYYRIAALEGNADAWGSVGLLLSVHPDLATTPEEGTEWLMVAARQGHGPAQELGKVLESTEKWFDSLPEKVSHSLLSSLMDKFIPQSDRGEPVVDRDLGELVFIPPTCWIQLSTGALYTRDGDSFVTYMDGRLALDIVETYPRGPNVEIERAGWVVSVAATLNRFLGYIRQRYQVA